MGMTKSGSNCNMCGKKLNIQSGILKEDVFEVVKEWGYFSENDLEIHRFTICEKCYNQIIDKFVIPVEKSKKKEVL